MLLPFIAIPLLALLYYVVHIFIVSCVPFMNRYSDTVSFVGSLRYFQLALKDPTFPKALLNPLFIYLLVSLPVLTASFFLSLPMQKAPARFRKILCILSLGIGVAIFLFLYTGGFYKTLAILIFSKTTNIPFFTVLIIMLVYFLSGLCILLPALSLIGASRLPKTIKSVLVFCTIMLCLMMLFISVDKTLTLFYGYPLGYSAMCLIGSYFVETLLVFHTFTIVLKLETSWLLCCLWFGLEHMRQKRKSKKLSESLHISETV